MSGVAGIVQMPCDTANDVAFTMLYTSQAASAGITASREWSVGIADIIHPVGYLE